MAKTVRLSAGGAAPLEGLHEQPAAQVAERGERALSGAVAEPGNGSVTGGIADGEARSCDPHPDA